MSTWSVADWGTASSPEKCLVCILTGNEGSLAVTSRGGWELCKEHAGAWDADERIGHLTAPVAAGPRGIT